MLRHKLWLPVLGVGAAVALYRWLSGLHAPAAPHEGARGPKRFAPVPARATRTASATQAAAREVAPPKEFWDSVPPEPAEVSPTAPANAEKR